MSLSGFGLGVHRLLQKPSRVFVLCALFAIISLVFDGSLWRLWGLHRDHDRLGREMSEVAEKMDLLKLQLKQAKDPSFIERQALDRLDLVDERDLVFVFPEDRASL